MTVDALRQLLDQIDLEGGPELARCEDTDCDIPLPYGRTGLCQGCADYQRTSERTAS